MPHYAPCRCLFCRYSLCCSSLPNAGGLLLLCAMPSASLYQPSRHLVDLLAGLAPEVLPLGTILSLRFQCGTIGDKLKSRQQTKVSRKLAMQPARIRPWEQFEGELLAWQQAIPPEIKQQPVRLMFPPFGLCTEVTEQSRAVVVGVQVAASKRFPLSIESESHVKRGLRFGFWPTLNAMSNSAMTLTS